MSCCVFPSSYDECLLFCSQPTAVILHKEDTQQSIFIQLEFAEKAFQEELVFVCDWMDARDGGIPYLSVFDIAHRKGLDVRGYTFAQRYQMLNDILDDPAYIDRLTPSNEFRVTVPLLYPMGETPYLLSWMPNAYHGLIRGLRLTEDMPKTIHQRKDLDFLVISTSVPDQYHVRNLDGSAVFGQDTLYVNSLDLSRSLARLARTSDTSLTCHWVPERQKWTPLLAGCNEKK